jgi:hypothetical protein
LPAFVTTSGAIQRVAYDAVGEFPICLKLWNNAGLSDEDCQTVEIKRETRARLSWMYRSTWVDHAAGGFFNDPADWFNNGHHDHGQQRHTFDANGSIGDVPIDRAWVELKLRYWENARNNLKDVTLTPWSAGVSPYAQAATEAHIKNRCGTGDVTNYQDGRWCYEQAWRLLVTPRPDGTMQLMYQPFYLGRDPNWYGGGRDVDRGTTYSEFTLHVVDVNGRETTDTKHRWHRDWSEGTIGWVGHTQDRPIAWFENSPISDDGQTMTLSGLRGQSAEGRAVRMWYVIEYNGGNGDPDQRWSQTVYGADSYELHLPECGRSSVTAMAQDDQGAQGQGVSYEMQSRDQPTCSRDGMVSKPR